MKMEDIRQLSSQELQDRITEEKSNYTRLAFSHTVSAIENPLKLRSIRKTIARLNTELRQREQAEAKK